MSEQSFGLESADAWAEFCDSLKAAGDVISGPTGPTSALDALEGYRFLSRMIGAGLDHNVEFADPLRPEWFEWENETRKLFMDNPDTVYHGARVAPDHTYRVFGNRGGAYTIGLVKYSSNVDQPGGLTISANLRDDEISFDADGNFEVFVGGPEREANWLPVEDEGMVAFRQYFGDRLEDEHATFEIELFDEDAGPLPVLDDAELASGLRKAAGYVASVAQFTAFVSHSGEGEPSAEDPDGPRIGDWMGESVPNNTLKRMEGAAAGFLAATPDNVYLAGVFWLRPDEMLVLEGTPPAHYWAVELMNYWQESLDFRYVACHINNSTVQLEDDGSYRIVIAGHDPGLPNWLDTQGRRNGGLLFRWHLDTDATDPTTRLLKIDDPV